MVCAVLLLTGALGSQSASTSRPAAAPLTADGTAPSAVRLLDQALELLDPSRLTWLETKLWQKGIVQGLRYVTEGRYLAAPDHRLCLELTTRHGDAQVLHHVVSDGATWWQGMRVGDGEWTATRVDLKQVMRVLQAPQAPVQLREDFLREHSFGGVVPLLRSLRQRMAWLRKETVRRNGREFFKLTGTWRDEEVSGLAPACEPWPDGLPRQCRLYLDVRNLWPHRVEWWGQDPPRPGDVLLVQMEFRDPVLNRPLSAQRCAREFSLPTTPHFVLDQTAEVIESLRPAASVGR
jgi:hypothetical protein